MSTIKSALSSTAWGYLLFALVVVVAVFAVGEDLREHLDWIEARLSDLGPLAWIGFVLLLVAATTVLIPESLLGIVGGSIFGFWLGLLLTVLGNLLAAAVQYWLARRSLSRMVQRAIAASETLRVIHEVFRISDLRMQVLVRLTPMNPAAINYLFGAGGVRFATYMIASLASFPHLLVEVFFGYAGRRALERTSATATAEVLVRDALILLGVLAAAGALLALSLRARRALDHAAGIARDKGQVL